MAHSEHNRSRRSGGFVLVIMGALLLFLAPGVYQTDQALGIAALVGGLAVGGIGFYTRFVKGRKLHR